MPNPPFQPLTLSQEAITLLNETAEAYKAGVWALFSGGDDSLTCAIVSSQAKAFRGCVHLDTGIGIPETREFVNETCKAQGWPLKVYRAIDCGQDYDALALQYGFPGPGSHFRMYIRLKERPLNTFIREHKRFRCDRLILATGARAQESKRRMGHVEPVRQDGVKVWVNPLHNWSKTDCLDRIASAGVPRNPVVELLHMSGECLCGAFAAPNELDEIDLWYPHVAQRIRGLEEQVRAAGKHCIWGTRPHGRKRRLGFGESRRDSSGRVTELCSQCELRFTDA